MSINKKLDSNIRNHVPFSIFFTHVLFFGSHFRIDLDFLYFGHFVEVGILGSCNFILFL